MTGFGQCIGNGLFWLAPFILYFLPLSIGDSSLFDNGHLQDGVDRYSSSTVTDCAEFVWRIHKMFHQRACTMIVVV